MSFDPTTFLDQTVTGANSTTMTPVPEGEFPGMAGTPEVKTWQSKDGSASGLKLELDWELMDDNLKAALDRKKVTCRQSIMLDLTESGALDLGKGKNIQLGRLREALNMNDPKKPFSFNMIAGNMAKVSVKHRIYNDDIFAEVKAVARI